MTAKECIMGRRSIRKFKDTPVDHEVVNEIIAAASYAPSWKHSQIARYVAVEGADVYKRQVLYFAEAQQASVPHFHCSPCLFSV